MKHLLFTFLLSALIISPTLAQPGGRGGTSIISPEVTKDGHVTFRL